MYTISYIQLTSLIYMSAKGWPRGEEKLLSSRHLKEETYELNRSTCISISRLLAFTQIRLLIVVRNAND